RWGAPSVPLAVPYPVFLPARYSRSAEGWRAIGRKSAPRLVLPLRGILEQRPGKNRWLGLAPASHVASRPAGKPQPGTSAGRFPAGVTSGRDALNP
ncbi:MAG: hypothetical protein N3A38_16680, partial [Planctomycetota bacterium]|nr:hypothetical protein [Planctomycetota bacterium]